MIYFRAVYDLAAVVKLASDRVSTADRIQMLTLLKGIQDYLQKADVLSSLQVSYDEPLVVIGNLVTAIQETNYAQFDNSILCSKKEMNTPRPVNQPSLAGSNIRKPQVFKGAAIKSAAPSAPESNEDDDDEDYHDDGENERSGDDDDDDRDMESNVVKEEVVYEVQDDRQSIDILEHTLTAIAQDYPKTNHTMDSSKTNGKQSNYSPAKNLKSKPKKRSLLPTNPQEFLPVGEEFINPVARVRTHSCKRKWPKNARWVCVYCRKVSHSVGAYKGHLHTVHRKEGPCSCKYCKKTILNSELLQYHCCRFRNKCNICHKLFRTPSRLRRHMGVHVKSTVVMIVCTLCSKYSAQPVRHFNSVKECADHVYDEHEIIIMCDSCLNEMEPPETTAMNPTRIYCQSCATKAGEGAEPKALPSNPNQEINISKQDVEIYKRSVSANPNIPQPAKAESESVPAGEIAKDSTSEDQSVHCEICDVTCKSQNEYASHITRVRHVKLASKLTGKDCPLFPCKECGKVFVTEYSCDGHFKRIHKPSDQVFPCSICRKVLKTAGGLKAHMRSHVNLRSFICDECGAGFNQRGDMMNHKQWKHTEGEPITCEHCDMTFKHRRKLKIHTRFAHDRLVYRCPMCDYEVDQPYSLKLHVVAVHDLKWRASSDYLVKSSRPYTPKTSRKRRSRSRGDSMSDDSDDEPLAKKSQKEDDMAADHIDTQQSTTDNLSKSDTEEQSAPSPKPKTPPSSGTKSTAKRRIRPKLNRSTKPALRRSNQPTSPPSTVSMWPPSTSRIIAVKLRTRKNIQTDKD